MSDRQYTLRFTESALSNSITCYEVVPHFPALDLLQFLLDIRHLVSQVIVNELEYKQSVKFWLCLSAVYEKITECKLLFPFFSSKQAISLDPSDVSESVKTGFSLISRLADSFEREGSSLVLDCVTKLDIHVVKYRPLKASTYIRLPRYIQSKKAVVNPINPHDNECFKWCILAALHPPSHHAERINQYRQYEGDLDFSGISFPVKIDDIEKFERQNNISVNVYEYDRDDARPLYLSHLNNGLGEIKLLLFEGHYCLIKNFSKLLGDLNNAQKCGHYCPKCMFPTYDPKKLAAHLPRCRNDELTLVRMPDPSKLVMKFRNYAKQLRSPVVIYADFECLTQSIQTCQPNPNSSFTQAYQKHEPYSYGLVVACSCCKPAKNFPYLRIYRGDKPVEHFIAQLWRIADLYQTKNRIAIEMTQSQEQEFLTSSNCGLCGDPLELNRVRDHCHICGKYRSALHTECNQQLRVNRDIVVVFHNLRRYDGHLLMQKIGVAAEEYGFQIDCIAKGIEDYVTFSLKAKGKRYRIRFIDSCQFMAASLEHLASLLPKEKMIALKEHFSQDKLELVARKGVFPYDYIDSLAKLDEKRLPGIDHFYSQLNEQPISESDYEHALRVMDAFKLSDIGEYSDLYLTCDVLLLADIFENFRDFCLQHHGLDPSHYCTISSFAFDACLKRTAVELDLLEDPDMYSFFESGIRGGIAMICKRYAKASNSYLSDEDSDGSQSYIVDLDANNLYGCAMQEKLPIGKFKWIDDSCVEIFDILNTDADGETGYILEVDLDYPAVLHDEHNCYPLAPERLTIHPEMLSPYCVSLNEKFGLKPKPTTKLAPNFFPKRNYAVHLKNLQYYVSKGLEVSRIHRILQFQQSSWLKPYISYNTQLRAMATSDFHKDLCKLFNNAVFGKTMENVRKYLDVKFATNAEQFRKLVKRPQYQRSSIFGENLIACNMQRNTVTLNKPIYVGFTVLELSKLVMYRFHYDYIKRVYGSSAELLMTDTDSLLYQISTTDLYGDMKANSHHFDTSNYDPQHPLYSTENKKVVGKMKDETGGSPISEFVGLRAKMYSFAVGSEEHKRAKGVKRAIVKRTLKHKDYKSVLFDQKNRYDKMNLIRSVKHQIYSICLNKKSLSCYDDKRFILDNGIETLAYGHYRTNHGDEPIDDVNMMHFLIND